MKLSSITRERIEAALKAHPNKLYAVYQVIDLLNGWDGSNGINGFNCTSLNKARKKLQQCPGSSTHEQPTSAQSSMARKHLEELSKVGTIEKQRGGGRSNNSYSYRFVGQAMLDSRAKLNATRDAAKDLARRVSLALGGDGTQGVEPIVTPDGQIGVNVRMAESTAKRVIAMFALTLGPT